MILYPDKTYYFCNRSKHRILIRVCQLHMGFPGSSAGKESACNAGDPDSWVGKIHWRRNKLPTPIFLGSPCDSAGKESACNVGDLGSILGLGKFPGEGKDSPLLYSGLENSMDCEVHGVTKSQTRLSDLYCSALGMHSSQ